MVRLPGGARRWGLAAIVTLLTTAVAASASAQWWVVEPPVDRTEFERFINDDSLTADERAIARDRYDSHVAELRDADEMVATVRRWNYSCERASDSAVAAAEFRQAVSLAIQQTEQAHRAGARTSVETFFTDLRTALPDRWDPIDRFERADRRRRLLDPLRLSRDGPHTGAAFDVIAFARSELGDRFNDPAVQEILSPYELEVDGLLRRYVARTLDTATYRSLSTAMRDKAAAGVDATRAVKEWADHAAEPGWLMVLLFRANDRASHALAAILEGEQAEMFRAEPGKRLIAWAYENVTTPSYLERALRRQDLPDAQRASLEAIRAEMVAMQATLEPRLESLHKRAMTRQMYEEYYIRVAMRGIAGEGGRSPLNDESVAMYAARDELVERMKDILTRAKRAMGEVVQ